MLHCHLPHHIMNQMSSNVGPMSRIHASSLDISTTRTEGDSSERACSNWPSEAAIVTGSEPAMASATAANASCPGRAASRQLSRRSGHAIQQPACGSNSPGIRKPSCAGVVSSVASFVAQLSAYVVAQTVHSVTSELDPLTDFERAHGDALVLRRDLQDGRRPVEQILWSPRENPDG